MGIVGAPFEDWVEKQIQERQKVYGASYKTPEQIQYMNNRGAWARIASSVDVAGTKAEELGIQGLSGKALAQSFVLFGGIANTSNGLQLSDGGVVNSQEARNNIFEASKFSYGLGTSEYGYTPPPGIDSLKVTHKNRGAIRQYDIKLKAQNKDQFNIIDALYLRLGYFLLVEWGHTSYFDTSDNSSEFISSPEFFTPAFNALFNDDFDTGDLLANLAGTPNDKLGDVDDILAKLKAQRRLSTGNYDGGLVKVTNFSWNFNADGTYDITISALSVGGLIDSLKLNFTGPKVTSFETKPTEKQQEKVEGWLPPSAADNANKNVNTSELPNQTTLENQNKSTIHNYLLAQSRLCSKQNWQKINDINVFKKNNSTVCINFKEENKPAQFYVPLWTVLDHINKVVLPLNHSNTANDNAIKNSKPLLNIALDGKMFTHFFQNSSDPLVCLVPFTAYNPEGGSAESYLDNILNSGFKDPDNPYAANLGAIYVNTQYVMDTLEKGTDEDTGDVNLVLFLDNLMKGINQSLGNINNFIISYDEVENEVLIIDDTVIPGLTDKAPTEIRVFGVQPDLQGSFVRNVSMTSKITNKIATQIAIGATANNTSINESTSLLGGWNSGLIDRVQLKSDNLLTRADEEDGSDALNKLKTQYDEYWKYIQETYSKFLLPSKDISGKAKKALPSILKYDISVKTKNGNIPSKGFIPVDLTLEVDGISGVLQYQKFTITPNILPPSYQDGIDFIIQGIDHTISNNQWTTSYTTLSVVRHRTPPTQDANTSFSILSIPPEGQTVNEGDQQASTQPTSNQSTNPAPSWLPPGLPT
jgi:hypothetical protein